MTVGELIERLKKFPPHFEVEAFHEGIEATDSTAEVVGVFNADATKIVSLELLTGLMPERVL